MSAEPKVPPPLPPLTEEMYAAVRGMEFELSTKGRGSVTTVFDIMTDRRL